MEIKHNTFEEHGVINMTCLDHDETENFGVIKNVIEDVYSSLDYQGKMVHEFLECLLKDLGRVKGADGSSKGTQDMEFSIARLFFRDGEDSDGNSEYSQSKPNGDNFRIMLKDYSEIIGKKLYDIREALILKPTSVIELNQNLRNVSNPVAQKDSFELKDDSIRKDEKAIKEQLEQTINEMKISLSIESEGLKKEFNPIEEVINNSKRAIKSRIMEMDSRSKNGDIELLMKEIESLKQMLRNHQSLSLPIEKPEAYESDDFQTSTFMKDLMKRIQFQKDDLGEQLNPQLFNRILSRKLVRLFNGYEYEENLFSCKSILKVFYQSITDFVSVFLDFVQLVSLFVNKISQQNLKQMVKTKIMVFCNEQVQRHETFAQTIEIKQNEYFTDIKEVKELALDYKKTFEGFTTSINTLVLEVRDIIVKDLNNSSSDTLNLQEPNSRLINL